MVGILIKKENVTAVARSIPVPSPPEIVNPERDAPGNNAMICAHPVISV